jgi:hypothetical protein
MSFQNVAKVLATLFLTLYLALYIALILNSQSHIQAINSTKLNVTRAHSNERRASAYRVVCLSFWDYAWNSNTSTLEKRWDGSPAGSIEWNPAVNRACTLRAMMSADDAAAGQMFTPPMASAHSQFLFTDGISNFLD